MIYRSRRTLVALFGLLAVVFAFGLFLALPAQGQTNAATVLRAAYARLTAVDGYAFSSTVVQTTHPLPTVANIGLSSQDASLLVTGAVDRAAERIELSMLEQSGTLLDGSGQVEVKVEAGKVWGRTPGQDWQILDEAAAPDRHSSEPAAFLQAARAVTFLGAEERLGESFDVYRFDIDGPAWAQVMRAELQRDMQRRGELAPGQVIDSLDYYAEMTGQGEVWVNAAGLPQRISVHVVYPPLPNEGDYREVRITSDYRDWRGLPDNAPLSLSSTIDHLRAQMIQSLPATWQEMIDFVLALLTPIALLGFLWIVLRHRRAIWLQRGLAFVLISMMLAEPLLNAGAVHAAGRRLDRRVDAVTAQRAEEDRVQTAIDAILADFTDDFDVRRGLVDQLSSAKGAADDIEFAADPAPFAEDFVGAAAVNNVDGDGDGLSDTLERQLGSDPAKKDSDGDGIDDGSEYFVLGLDPTDPDSDGDLLSDGFEIAGVERGGKRWYLNPRNRDSNNDGLTDSVECIQAIDVVVNPAGKGVKGDPKGTGICDDSDGDGTPDFADDDNDNDGVGDWQDGQPQARFGDPTTGVKDNAFAYGIDNYSAGKPLRLTFELRPTTPQHLWYSMNVLDWPSGDYDGQIRRVKDTTIGSSGSLANGDMQLVPMLEVTLPAAEAVHLPTIPGKAPVVGDNSKLAEWLNMDVLQRYQMAVSWTQDRQSLRVYLPATLIRDTKGNAPLNFVAKMLYWPSGTGLFSTNHTARLAWLVQLDVDNCTVPADSTYQDSCLPEGSNYQNGVHWQTAKQQIVHRYYDSFYLNAFTAEEDLGSSAQIFYERPDQIANKAAYVPDQLLGLGSLMELYLRQNKTPAQALTAYQAKSTGLGNRLAGSAVIADADVYGLASRLATQETPALLNNVFAPHKDQLPYPTMLYVTWGKAKINGLAGVGVGDALKINMAAGTLKSSTSVRVGAFAYNPNPSSIGGQPNPNWNPVDPGTIWTAYLKNQSVLAYQQLPQAARQKIDVDRFQQGALSMYWNLARGIEISSDFSSALAESKDSATGFVDEFGAGADNLGENAIGAMIAVLDDFKEAQEGLTQKGLSKSLFSLTGKDVKNAANVKGALTSSKWAKGIGTAAVTFAGLSATVSIVLAAKDLIGLGEGAVAALEAANAALGAVLAGLQAAQEITKLVQNVQAFSGTAMQGLKSSLAFTADISKVGAWAAVIVAAVIVVAALVMFFVLGADTVAGKTALAQGVATAIVVLLLFVISLFFPIGTALAVIAGLIDGVITAICKIKNWLDGKDADGKTFEDRNKSFCSGIVGNTVAAIAGFFYRSIPMVDMSYKDRLQFGQTDTKLIEQNGLLGMSADNRLEVKQPVTVTVRIPDAHSFNPANPLTPTLTYTDRIAIDGGGALMLLSDYDRLIKEKSVFNYELVTAADADETDDLKKTTPDRWQSVGDNANRNRLFKTETATLQITLTAGINFTPTLLVREYYTYYLAVCGVTAGGCDYKFDHFTRSEAGKTEILDLGKNLIYDVFPSTLTGLYTLAQVQENGQFVNRYRLAWGGNKAFPVLVDADGDGLRSDGSGALDPDDKSADSDNDGLPDAFEVQDSRLNPLAADSDNDGLTDYQEMRHATRPDRSDSDGDGLSDAAEIAGWEFVYVDAANVTQRTWVTSDPLVFDTDGDGFADGQERTFGFHPRARTLDPKILTLTTRTNQTGSTFLGPQQSINFTSTVKNELRQPIAYGLLEAEILNANSAINPLTFELQPQQSTDIRGSISVPATPPAPGSDEITLRNRAGANLVDPTASYAAQLQGLAPVDGLKFLLNFEQRQPNPADFGDVTGRARLTCPGGDGCPNVIVGTNSYARFDSRNWYAAGGDTLSFSQPRFSLGGWITLRRAFGDEYSERVILGPDNVGGGVDRYLQLSVVDLMSTPKVKVSFTATDGAQCEQILTALTLPYDQRSHIFVTYDGAVVRGFKDGVDVGAYNLQNCANKIPAGNRFTIGRGSSHATLYVDNVYLRSLDEGTWPNRGEPYMLLNQSTQPFWSTTGVRDGNTPGVGRKLTLRDSSQGDADSTVYLCEEDNGDKQGQCRSNATDSDDRLGTVTVSPLINRSYDSSWSGPDGSGNLRYNVQNNFFHGDLDDLRIYEKTLNSREIGQLVNGGGLTYQLDEASGRTQFRNTGVDTTQLTCATPGNCPTSGVKGYAGQAVRFSGSATQSLSIDSLRQRFGSNFVVDFWLKPDSGATTSGAVPLIRAGQGTQGYTLFATAQGTQTALNSRFMFSETGYGVIGGSGGGGYNLRCNADEALVGLYGGAGALVDRVGALCVRIDAAGQWIGEPRQAGSAGGNGGSSYERRCAVNAAVVGFNGRSGGLVDQINVLCAPLAADGYADSRNPSTLARIGGSGGSQQEPRICPSNLPAAGIYGRAGGAVDSFGLLCRDQFSGAGRTVIANGQWTHIALAQREETLRLYVNGQLQQDIWFGSPSLNQYRLTGSGPDLRLGSQLAGLLDEVQVQGLEGSTNQSVDAQVAALYRGSAVAYLAFDDLSGATTFVNSTGRANLTCTGNACPQAAVKGQVRESVLFNGQAGAATLAIADQRDAAFAFATWIKLPAAPTGSASIVSLHESAGAATPSWRLQISNKNGRAVPELTGRTSDGASCGIGFTVTPKDGAGQDLALALNQWHHLGVSYNPLGGNNEISLYVNGQLVHQQRLGSLICRVGTSLQVGQNLRGQIDEFVFYQKPLVVSDFLSQYVYQSTWFDVTTTEKFRVDYTAPTLRLTANSFVKAGTTIFGVAAGDAESGIRAVEYKDGNGVWRQARSETATSGVWAFGLDVQGNTTVEVRATDNVGNVRTDSKTVAVDNTPPAVTLTTGGKQKTLTLEGTVADTGSGLQSATIVLYDALGNAMNTPRDLAVSNGIWRYTQDLPPLVNDTFRVWVSAVDQIGNRFEGIIGTVTVDNAAPVAGLITGQRAYGGVAANLPVIRGFVTDQPYPVGMSLFVGFEDQPAGGVVNSTLDQSGNRWQAVTSSTGPAIVASGALRQADFQLGQTLVITNALPNPRRIFRVNPDAATLAFRVNPNSVAPAEQRLVHQGGVDGFGLILKGDQLTLRVNRNGAPIDKDTGQRVVAGQWQQIVVSFGLSGTQQAITSWVNVAGGNSAGKTTALAQSERIVPSAAALTIGATVNGYAGKFDDLVVYNRPLSDLEARQLSTSAPSVVQGVEVGFLHRQDINDPGKVVWYPVTLGSAGATSTTWQLTVPAGLEGIYDLSLRTSDALGNQRSVGGVWTGVIDTRAPNIVLSGAGAGTQQCVVTDFSLGQSKFICAATQNAAGAAKANFADGTLPAASLTWNTGWFTALFARTTTPARLYAMQQGGLDFSGAANTAESCDIYGNCTLCTVTANNLASPSCSVYSAAAARSVLAQSSEADDADDALSDAPLLESGAFTVTVAYQRPDAYVPGTEPGAATFAWAAIDEPGTLIDDAVLAATRPFAADFNAAKTAIAWGESISATQYYAGWTLSESAVISDLVAYAVPGTHLQTLPDQGRYYAHVVAVDEDDVANVYTLGPIYFDGATPASYLNWDEYGPGQPYRLWQDAASATGQVCNLLGVDERVALFTNGTSARSATQSLYATWDDEWLAVHWDGLNVDLHGDLHLYFDTKVGGALYAFNPYTTIAQADALVTMPERRQYQSNTVDRMLADFAVIVEDGDTLRFVQWTGSTWQTVNAAPLKFQFAGDETILWLPLATLGVNPAAVDVSMVGFATEDGHMQVWATLPSNNPLNSAAMRPEHAPAPTDVDAVLVNLQNSMRLSANPALNNTLDNCPTNIAFDQSILDVDFSAVPAGEVYDPVVYEGIRAVVPDDVETLLAALCAGVDDGDSPVCQLAAQVAANVGGGGPEVGPNGLLPATAGPDDEIVYYVSVRNLSDQESGDLSLNVESNLPIHGAQLPVGVLAPLESRVISFTETVAPGAAYTAAEVTIYPIEAVTNDEENIVLTYVHSPHSVIHDIDRTAPFSAELTSETINNFIGVGEQFLQGLVYDQSAIAQLTLQTSLGGTFPCTDTLAVNAFASEWLCAVTLPENTPDGTTVTVSVSATDAYGFASGVIGQWSFTVDNAAPTISLLEENRTRIGRIERIPADQTAGNPPQSAQSAQSAFYPAAISSSTAVTEVLVLEGVAVDNQLLDAVAVCDTLDGFERCQEAELFFFTDVFTTSVQAAGLAAAADEAYWVLESEVARGIENRLVPYRVVAYDAFGNAQTLSFDLQVDTLPPTVTLSAPPPTQIDYGSAFVLDGAVTDKGTVSFMELEVLTPLGEYAYYTVTLAAPDSVATTWQYVRAAGDFAAPGEYVYTVLAYDGFGNETEAGPFTLRVEAPPTLFLNDPLIVETSNDLWAGFAPGGVIYLRAAIDDADLSLGDVLTVTAQPLPSWLALTRLDERSFEISGTVPLTITEIAGGVFITDTAAFTEPISVQISAGVVVEDSSGRQDSLTWTYDLLSPTWIYLPRVHGGRGDVVLEERWIYLPSVNR